MHAKNEGRAVRWLLAALAGASLLLAAACGDDGGSEGAGPTTTAGTSGDDSGEDTGDDTGDGEGANPDSEFCQAAVEMGNIGEAFVDSDPAALRDLFVALGDLAEAAPPDVADDVASLRDLSERLAEVYQQIADDPSSADEVQQQLADLDPGDAAAALGALQEALQEECGLDLNQG